MVCICIGVGIRVSRIPERDLNLSGSFVLLRLLQGRVATAWNLVAFLRRGVARLHQSG